MRIHPYTLAVILSAVLLIPSASGQPSTPPKRPMTFADLMQMRRLGDTDVSPDGKWLVYSVTDVDLAKNTKTATLWIQAIAGGEPKRLEGTQPGDGGARFSHDGKQLLFLSGRSGKQQIWILGFDTASGTTRNPYQANPQDGPFQLTHNSMEPDNARWSPDGRTIVFTASVYPDCPAFTQENASEDSESDKCNANRDKAAAESKVKAQIFDHLLYRHWNQFTGPKRSHLFEVTVENPSPRTLAVRDLTPNDPHDVPPFSLGGDGGFAFSPDSKELAFTENLDEEPAISTNADIFTLDLTNSAAKPVKVSTSPGGDFNPAYSPDGKYLAWRSQARSGYESDKFRLALYDRSQKSIQYMLPVFDRWVDEFAWGPSSTVIFLTAGDQGGASVFALQLKTSTNMYNKAFRLVGYPKEVLAKGGDISRFYERSELGDLRPLADGKTLLVSHMTVRSPQEVHSLDVSREDGAVCTCDLDPIGTADSFVAEAPVTHLNDALLARLDLSAMGSFRFSAADKTDGEGFLIKPPGFDPAKKYPVKFLIHGGPQGAWGDAWSYRWNAELLAANGYVVIMINPRGSTGYGQAFVDGVNGDWGGKPFTDLMAGLDYAEKTYPFIDKNRECALGASYGGYMANWILGHTDRFKCIVTHDGMYDPESAFGSTEEDWFNIWEFRGHPWDYYGKPDSENPFRKWSPARSAKNFKTPTLVIHSQLDYRLDVSEGFQLFDTLQMLHVPSKMLYFPDEGHWVLKPQNSELWYKTVNAWVDEWTKK